MEGACSETVLFIWSGGTTGCKESVLAAKFYESVAVLGGNSCSAKFCEERFYETVVLLCMNCI